MDYEKAYKAALKTATQWIKDGCTDKEKICLECVFPELRESEDERIRKFLVDYFVSYKIGNVTTKLNGVRIDDILNYLEKQKEQKPAEWSNKDEEMMTEIIEFLEYAYPYDNEFRIAWLKSLRVRPKSSDNWKPSEDQMNVLLNTEGMIRASGYPENAKVLASLYEELKKL